MLLLQFSSDVNQTSWGFWLPSGNIGYYFSWQPAKFLKNCGTWNFNLEINGKSSNMEYLESNFTVEQNGWAFVTRGPRNSICRVLFGSGHLGSLCKFLMLRFSKGCYSPSFHQISTKPYRKHVPGENTGYYFFWLSANLYKCMAHWR